MKNLVINAAINKQPLTEFNKEQLSRALVECDMLIGCYKNIIKTLEKELESRTPKLRISYD